MEIMTHSDTVLRAGMTVKPRHAGQVLDCVGVSSRMPWDSGPSTDGTDLVVASGGASVRVMDPAIPEFLLILGELPLAETGTATIRVTGRGPRIMLCLSGAMECRSGNGRRVLRMGEAVFVPAVDGDLTVSAVRMPGRTDGGCGCRFVVATTGR